jgi:ketosteroid isomerase-like protein
MLLSSARANPGEDEILRAMSQENVEIVRAMFERWNERRLGDFRDLHDPDVIIARFIEGWPEPGPVVGRAAVMDLYEDVRPGDDATVVPVGDFIQSGSTVAVRIRWRTAIQDQEVGMELTGVYTIRSGRIFVIEFFRDHAEALEAAGLSE